MKTKIRSARCSRCNTFTPYFCMVKDNDKLLCVDCAMDKPNRRSKKNETLHDKRI